MTKAATLIVCAILCLIGSFACAEDVSELVKYDGIVTRVIDGNEIEIDGQPTLLLGVDAPRRWLNGGRMNCYSVEASDYLAKLVLGRLVQYAYDPTQWPINRKSRKHVYLFADGKLVNEELIATGYAFANRKMRYLEKKRFATIQADAKLDRLHLWHTCPVECNRTACRSRDW